MLLFFMMSFESSLCILDTNPFLDLGFANIFAQSIAIFSSFLTKTFTGQKFVILMKSNLSVFPFINSTFGIKCKNTSPRLKYWRLSPILFKKFYFYVFFHDLFWINVFKSVKFGSTFIFLSMDVQLPQHYLLKKLSFPHQIALTLLSQISWAYVCWSIPWFSPVSFIYVPIPLPLLQLCWLTVAIQ